MSTTRRGRSTRRRMTRSEGSPPVRLLARSVARTSSRRPCGSWRRRRVSRSGGASASSRIRARRARSSSASSSAKSRSARRSSELARRERYLELLGRVFLGRRERDGRRGPARALVERRLGPRSAPLLPLELRRVGFTPEVREVGQALEHEPEDAVELLLLVTRRQEHGAGREVERRERRGRCELERPREAHRVVGRGRESGLTQRVAESAGHDPQVNQARAPARGRAPGPRGT